MVTGEALRSAGWRLTAEHSSSSYNVPVIVAPDGQAIGDGDLVRVRFDGELMADPFGLEGRLLAGVTIRELLEDTEEELLKTLSADEMFTDFSQVDIEAALGKQEIQTTERYTGQDTEQDPE